MSQSRIRDIKHAQKESFIMREVMELFREIVREKPMLAELFLTRVALSPDKGVCTVYFYTSGGESAFNHVKGHLLPCRHLIRHALSQAMTSRYVPEIIFKYDHAREKQQRVDDLLEQLKARDAT